ncbi:MAG: zinc ribbon domain-containing protein [Desulfobulbaceae bacterium]|jgi:putative FmdB family regulatory protein|nr:zinc ribbon domain-containing protein [Desulfobulbaceae bacterium]
MPVYEYECDACKKIFEKQQKMSDAPLTVCEHCGGHLKKLVSISSFQLKGGGWYADGYANCGAGSCKSTAESASPCASGSCCAGCQAGA